MSSPLSSSFDIIKETCLISCRALGASGNVVVCAQLVAPLCSHVAVIEARANTPAINAITNRMDRKLNYTREHV